MTGKLITSNILEILVIVILLSLSFPLWNTFTDKISAASITSLDDFTLNFTIYQDGKGERIVITNDYYLNKNYKIYLIANKELSSNSSIIIDNKIHHISEFYQSQSGNHHLYTLVNNYLTSNKIAYKIELETEDQYINYSYMFEEKSIF